MNGRRHVRRLKRVAERIRNFIGNAEERLMRRFFEVEHFRNTINGQKEALVVIAAAGTDDEHERQISPNLNLLRTQARCE